MKACIVSVNGSISDSEYSHRASWPRMRRLQLLETKAYDVVDLDPPNPEEYDVVLHYAGMEWAGILNLFGGAVAKNAERLMTLARLPQSSRLMSLDIDMPDFGALGKSRAPGDDTWATADWDALSAVCRKAPKVPQHCFPRLVIGDSHATSQYLPGSTIYRHDFKTLHGFLKDGLDGLFCYVPKTVTWYFGNIDIRHHLCRMPDPKAATVALVTQYVAMAKATAETFGLASWEIVAPLPIETESRRIPESGFYKGRPFWGTWAEREAIRNVFTDTLDQLVPAAGGTVWKWPDWFRLRTGELDQEYMERPGSVHLAWKYARLNLVGAEPDADVFDLFGVGP